MQSSGERSVRGAFTAEKIESEWIMFSRAAPDFAYDILNDEGLDAAG